MSASAKRLLSLSLCAWLLLSSGGPGGARAFADAVAPPEEAGSWYEPASPQWGEAFSDLARYLGTPQGALLLKTYPQLALWNEVDFRSDAGRSAIAPLLGHLSGRTPDDVLKLRSLSSSAEASKAYEDFARDAVAAAAAAGPEVEARASAAADALLAAEPDADKTGALSSRLSALKLYGDPAIDARAETVSKRFASLTAQKTEASIAEEAQRLGIPPTVGDEAVQGRAPSEARPLPDAAPATSPVAATETPFVVHTPAVVGYLKQMLKSRALGHYTMLAGEAGTGKNALIYELARLRGAQVKVLSLNEQTDMRDLTVRTVLKDGKTSLEPSALVEAMEKGQEIVLDEVDRAPPGVLAGLNNLLQFGELTLPDGRVVKAKGGFFVWATRNPPRAPYRGDRLSGELEDRFSILSVDYLPELEETAILAAKAPGLGEEKASLLVRAANALRDAYRKGLLPRPVSMRALLRTAETLSRYPSTSFQDAFRAGYNVEYLDEALGTIVKEALTAVVPLPAEPPAPPPAGLVKDWSLKAKAKVYYEVLSPDGKYLYTHGIDGVLRKSDAATGVELKQYTEDKGISSVLVSPDGKRLFTQGIGEDFTRLLDEATGERLPRNFPGRPQALSPDGRYLYTIGSRAAKKRWFGGTSVSPSPSDIVQVWDVETGKEISPPFEGHSKSLTGVTASKDGKYLFTSSFDGTARQWDVALRKELRRFEANADAVSDSLLSPDERYLFTWGSDRSVRMWDIKTGAQMRRFVGHKDAVRFAAMSPDGRFLFTVGCLQDQSLRMWDTATGLEVRHWEGFGGFSGVSVSPDGRYVYTTSGDAAARKWEILEPGTGAPEALKGPEPKEAGEADLRLPEARGADAKIPPFVVHTPTTEGYLKSMLKSRDLGHYTMLAGEAGTGKNALIYELARVRGAKVKVISLNEQTELRDLTVRTVLKDGKTSLEPSALVEAMEKGDEIVLDEMDRAPPGVLAGLNNLLQFGEVTLPDGRVVKAKPGFFVWATRNPPRAPYRGEQLSGELEDRFSILTVDYLPEGEEAAILSQKAPALGAARAGLLVRAADELRASYRSGLLPRPVSMRALLRTAEILGRYPTTPFWDAFQAGYNIGYIDEPLGAVVKKTLEALGLLDPQAPPAPQVPAPAAVPDAAAFIVHTPTAESYLQQMLKSRSLGHYTMLAGEAGTGKNALIYESARLRGAKVKVISLNEQTELRDLIVRTVLKDGKTSLEPSALVEAMEKGEEIVLDEVDRAPAGVLAGLNNLLQFGEVTLPDGRVVKAKPGFFVWATRNPPRAPYRGEQLSGELEDRFSILTIDYLPESEETAILEQKAPSLGAERASGLVRAANALRASYRDGLLPRPVSMRALLRTAEILSAYPHTPLWDAFRAGYNVGYVDETLGAAVKRTLEALGLIKAEAGAAAPLEPEIPEPRVPKGKELAFFDQGEDHLFLLTQSPDSRYLFTAGTNGKLWMWDTTTGTLGRVFEGKSRVVAAIPLRDGKTLFTAELDGIARLWDIATGEELRSFAAPLARVHAKLAASIYSASLSRNEKYFYLGEEDGTSKWDLASAKRVFKTEFKSKTRLRMEPILSPDDKVLYTSEGHSVVLLDAETGAELRRFEGHTDEISDAVLSAGGSYLYTSGQEGLGRLWDVSSGKEVQQFKISLSHRVMPVFSPDEKHLFLIRDQTQVELWDIAGAWRVRTFSGHKEALRGMTLSADGRRLFTTSWDTTARMWDVATGRELLRYDVRPLPDGRVDRPGDPVLSADGKRLFTRGLYHSAAMWEVPEIEYEEPAERLKEEALTPPPPPLAPIRREGGRLHILDASIPLGPGADVSAAPLESSPFIVHTPTAVDYLEQMLKSRALGHYTMLAGEAGTGKNALIYELARLRGAKVKVISLNEQTELRDLTVRTVLKDGKTSLEPSALVEAMQDGEEIVLDEVDRAPPGVLAGLNNLLQFGEVTLPDGRVVKAKPGFFVWATRNPPRAPYRGEQLSGELEDRFSILSVDYLPQGEEAAILAQRAPGLSAEKAGLLVRAANELRASYRGGLLPRPVSMRALLRTAQVLNQYPATPFWDAFQAGYNIGYIDEPLGAVVKKTLEALGLVSPQTPPPPQEPAPAAVADAAAFIVHTPTAESYLRQMLKSRSLGHYTMLAGEAGTGKNALIYESARLRAVHVKVLSLNEQTEMRDLTARTVLKDGKTSLEPSALVEAMQNGEEIVLDEVDRAPAGVLAGLNNLLQFGEVTLPDGRVVKAKPGFFVWATSNPPRAPYRGEHLSGELEDRFSIMTVDYLPEAEETAVLSQKAPELSQERTSQLVRTARQLRESYRQGLLPRPISMRALLRTAAILSRYPSTPLPEAFRAGYNVGYMDESLDALVIKALGAHGAQDDEDLVPEEGSAPGLRSKFGSGIGYVVPSPDGRHLFTLPLGNQKSIELRDASTGEVVRRFGDYITQRSMSVVPSPDGKHVFVGTGDEELVHVWDASTGRELPRTFKGRHPTLSPDGKTLFTIYQVPSSALSDLIHRIRTKRDPPRRDVIRIWDAETGKELGPPIEGFESYLQDLTLSPDGRFLFAAGPNAAATMLDWRARKELRRFQTPTGIIFSIAGAPDGKSLVTVSNHQQTASLWDTATGAELRRFRAPRLYGAAQSPDGRYVLLWGGNPALLMDKATGAQVRSFDCSSDVYSAAFSPDGRSVYTTSADGVLRIWDVAPEADAETALKTLVLATASGEAAAPANDIALPSPANAAAPFIVHTPTADRYLKSMLKSRLLGHYTMLAGEAGTGKNALIYELARLRGAKVKVISLNEQTELRDLTVRTVLKDGKTALEPSALVEAMENGNEIVLDEVDRAPAGVLAGLNNLLQFGEVTLPDGRVVKAKPGFFVWATRNPPRAPYRGEQLSGELEDRFSILSVDYLPEAEETAILSSKAPALGAERADLLVRAANELRASYRGGLLPRPLSMRALLRTAQILSRYPSTPMWDAFQAGYNVGYADEALGEVVKKSLQAIGLIAPQPESAEAPPLALNNDSVRREGGFLSIGDVSMPLVMNMAVPARGAAAGGEVSPEQAALLEGLARMLTHEPRLSFKPWRSLGPSDTEPGWRFLFERMEIQYDPADLAGKDPDVASGKTMHELWHLLYTRPEVLEPAYHNQTFHSLWNAIEDPRVNTMGQARHPGSRLWLQKTYQDAFGVKDLESETAFMATVPLHLQFGHALIYRWWKNSSDPRIVTPQVNAALNRAWPDIKEAFSTPDARRSYEIIRDKIWPVYQELAKQAQDKQVEQEMMDKMNGQPGDKSEKAESGEEESQSHQGESSDSDSSGGPKPGKPVEPRGRQKSLDQLPEAERRQMEKTIKEALDKLSPEERKQLEEAAAEKIAQAEEEFNKATEAKLQPKGPEEQQKLEEFRGKEEEQDQAAAKVNEAGKGLEQERLRRAGISAVQEQGYLDYRAKVAPAISTMRAKWQQLLEKRRRKRTLNGLISGDLSEGHLAEAAAGRDDVFQRRLKPGKFAVQISLLVDLSGSMSSDHKYQSAIAGAVLLMESLKDISGVDFEIVGYKQGAPAMMLKSYQQRMTPALAVQVVEGLENGVGGGNGDDEALVLALERMRSRPDGVKLVIMSSDGDPNGGTSREQFASHIHGADDALVFGLGIGPESKIVETLFPPGRAVWAENPIQVPQGIARILQTTEHERGAKKN